MPKKKAVVLDPLSHAEREIIDEYIDRKPCLRCKSKRHRGSTCPRTKPTTWGELLAKKSAGRKLAINAYLLEKQRIFWEGLSVEGKKKRGIDPPWERFDVKNSDDSLKEESDDERKGDFSDTAGSTPNTNGQDTQSNNTDDHDQGQSKDPNFGNFPERHDTMTKHQEDFP